MHNKKNIIALCAISVLISAACNTPPQSAPVDIESQVSVRELKFDGSISRLVNTSGTVLAMSSVDLNSEISGHYHLQNNPRTGRPFKLGDAVRKDELMIRFEDNEYENNIRISSRRLSLEIAEQEHIKQKELLEKGGVTATQVRNAEITVANARYDLTNATLNLEKMNVKAPFDGVIVNLPHYTPNTRVSSNQPMVSLMSYSNMFMEINLPESAIEHIQINQPVHITHYILPEDTLKGVISELSPAISSETRTNKRKILINNSELKLRPGMFGKADVIIERSENVIEKKKNVLQTARNRRFVYVVERNTAIIRNLVTGIEDEENVEVLDGLHENDQLIIRGYETLRENSRVRVIR
jgi:RND family efflux transporter MFP subunit